MHHTFNVPLQVHSATCGQQPSTIGPGLIGPPPLEALDRFGKTTVRRADRTGGADAACEASDGQPLTVALELLKSANEQERAGGEQLLTFLVGTGDSVATLMMAQALMHGQGVQTDQEQAMYLLHRLVANPFRPGHVRAAAKFMLADACRLGLGVPAQPQAAVHFYMEAADEGFTAGAMFVGWWFQGDRPDWSAAKPDLRLAARYFRLGAADGCSECATALALIHLRGQIPGASRHEGMGLLMSAAGHGHLEAVRLLQDIEAGDWPEPARAARPM